MTTILSGSRKEPMPRVRKIVIAYPFILVFIATLLNLVLWGVTPITVDLPTVSGMIAASISAALLLLNHSWIMSATELTRIDYGIATAPENASGTLVLPEQTGEEAKNALARTHRTHQNATENTVYFALLAPLFLMSSPPELAVWVWFLCFSLGRLGHSLGYLTAHTTLRGLAMSTSLIGLYGMASYMLLSLVL